MVTFKEYLLLEIAKSTYKDVSDETLKSYKSKYSSSSDPTDRMKLNAITAELKRRGHSDPDANKTGKEIGKPLQKKLSKPQFGGKLTGKISGDSNISHIGDFNHNQKNKFSKHVSDAASSGKYAGLVIKKDGKTVSSITHDDNGITYNKSKKFAVTHHTGENAKETDSKWERKYPWKKGNYERELRKYDRTDLNAEEALHSIVSKHGEGSYSVHGIERNEKDEKLRAARTNARNTDVPEDKKRAADKFIDKHLGSDYGKKSAKDHDDELDKHIELYKAGKLKASDLKDKIDNHSKNKIGDSYDSREREGLKKNLSTGHYGRRSALRTINLKKKYKEKEGN